MTDRYTTISNSIDGKINKELLDKKRDKTVSIKDIYDAFDIIREKIGLNDYTWIDTLYYVSRTLNDLEKQGCDVKKLKHVFIKETKELMSNEQ